MIIVVDIVLAAVRLIMPGCQLPPAKTMTKPPSPPMRPEIFAASPFQRISPHQAQIITTHISAQQTRSRHVTANTLPPHFGRSRHATPAFPR